MGNGLDRGCLREQGCLIFMRVKTITVAAVLCSLFASAAIAADATFDVSDTKNVLHAVNGKTYWEMFAVCFASANAGLEKAALEHNEARQRDLGNLATQVLERGIGRLVADRTVFEGEAEEVFLARAAQSPPVAEFAGACRLYVLDHDQRFGPPK